MTAWQTVHVRVNDAATGKPTPVLIRFTGPNGNYYPPFGRLAEFATDIGADVGGNVLLGREQHAFIDGACEVRLPVGAIRVEARKGPQYKPLFKDITLSPGKLALRLTIERWADAVRDGWYSGDTQAFFLSPHAALLEAAAQDLNIVNVLARSMGEEGRPPALSNLLAFSGQRPALESDASLVVVNTLNEHPTLGRLALLNCHRVVYPLTFGGPTGYEDWTLADWCDQCHRKGGLVVAADFFSNERWKRGEVIADLILGKVDALDVAGAWTWGPGQAPTAALFEPYYHLLNCGIRVPLAGGSAKISNKQVLGSPRTYGCLQPGEALTYRAWIEAVRAGRTFVGNGALLAFQVNGEEPGAVLNLPESARSVHVRAEVRDFGRHAGLEILHNGRVVASTPPVATPPWLDERGGGPLPASTMQIDEDVAVDSGGWLAARYGRLPIAHSSPVYVRVGGKSPPIDPDALAFVRGHLDGMLEWVDHEGRFEDDQQRQRLAGVFESAHQALAARARPE